MKILLLFILIGCTVTMGAAAPVLGDASNYISLLDMPKEKLETGLQQLVEEIKASKIPTPDTEHRTLNP